jgi:hypothetical protein
MALICSARWPTVTVNREGDYNRQTEAHDWKRRGERLVLT